jgi:hypothetical protein
VCCVPRSYDPSQHHWATGVRQVVSSTGSPVFAPLLFVCSYNIQFYALGLQTVIENLKGSSSNPLYRRLRTVAPFPYQCSESSTADEIKSVFDMAVSRFHTNRSDHFNDTMVVFLDEAGLPPERHEALKIIHEYLDKQEVRGCQFIR